MPKPKTFDGYDEEYTLDCERVLVTLLRGLGPWKDSVSFTCLKAFAFDQRNERKDAHDYDVL